MYNFIRKDVVVSAIKWLKESNKLYGYIELNEAWADECINSDFHVFLISIHLMMTSIHLM